MTTVEQLETVDITKLNAIAAGTNKKVPRVVAGLGGKSSTSDLVKVTAEEITKDSWNHGRKGRREKQNMPTRNTFQKSHGL